MTYNSVTLLFTYFLRSVLRLQSVKYYIVTKTFASFDHCWKSAGSVRLVILEFSSSTLTVCGFDR